MQRDLVGRSQPDAPRGGLDEDWMDQARCRDLAPDWESIDQLFHSPNSQHAEQDARRICATCPVRRCCLQYAIALEIQPYVFPVRTKGRPRQKDYKTEDASGMWGGVTAGERASTRGMPPAERLETLEAIHRRKAQEMPPVLDHRVATGDTGGEIVTVGG